MAGLPPKVVEERAFASYARLRGNFAEHPAYHQRLWATLEPDLCKLLVAMWAEGYEDGHEDGYQAMPVVPALTDRIEELEVFLGEAVAYIENPAGYHSSGEQVARGCRQILEKTNAWA
jgi:hypothetical protein